MAQKPKKLNKKPMTLEDFAVAIQTDLARMATKDDLTALATKEDIRNIRDEMATHKDLLEVRDDVKRLNDIMVSKADLSETIRRELDASPFAKQSEVKNLSERLLRVEEKLGLKPGHRPA